MQLLFFMAPLWSCHLRLFSKALNEWVCYAAPRDKCNRCDTPKPPGAGGGGGGGRGGGRVQAAPQGPAGNEHSRLLLIFNRCISDNSRPVLSMQLASPMQSNTKSQGHELGSSSSGPGPAGK